MMPALLLLLPWGSLLFGGFLFGPSDPYRRMPLWTRLASSAVLVMAAWLLAASGPHPYTTLIASGMSLGFLGDLFMADLIPWPRPHVLGGIGSFGLGHIAYITACFNYGGDAGFTASAVLWLSWIMWLVIALIGWYFIVWRGAAAHQRGPLHLAALPYACLLASTAGVGTGLALQTAAFTPFALGAALFLLSDLLIAADLFNHRRFPGMGDVIWLTYGPAQALIIFTATRL